MEGEQKQIEALITEYTDVFACSFSEVMLIPGARVNLNVPKDACQDSVQACSSAH